MGFGMYFPPSRNQGSWVRLRMSMSSRIAFRSANGFFFQTLNAAPLPTRFGYADQNRSKSAGYPPPAGGLWGVLGSLTGSLTGLGSGAAPGGGYLPTGWGHILTGVTIYPG